MNIGDIKIWPTKGNSSVKANGIVTLNDVMNVKFTIFNGSKGTFVGFPGKYGEKVDPNTGKKPWYPDVSFPKNDEAEQFKNKLNQAIVNAYNKATGNDMNQGTAAGPTNQECPF